MELAVNDEGVPEHSDNMDNLIRGLLEMENGPAVVLLEVAAFSNGLMSGGGGRMHLPVAQYYGKSDTYACANSRRACHQVRLPTSGY